MRPLLTCDVFSCKHFKIATKYKAHWMYLEENSYIRLVKLFSLWRIKIELLFHIIIRHKQQDDKTREIKWLIWRHSQLSLENKIIIYKTVLKPIWTYGIELWGCASNSSIQIIQRYQSKTLKTLTNAPWYVTIPTLHSVLRIPNVREVFQERNATHRTAIASHPNPLMVPLLHLPTTRRLKRRWTLDGTH
jgi:hypothetical protein